ncbi:hypothetical protein CVIRNUC_006976 [Coccomyxa viridis]|uniref:Uncharacterized protein n=1 Tax=Coccomyxa viridis TaxID=1274662 RepID=A0AAV1IA76_9CHLO|nr:hypothetical protein CVIRNUC_006976 [Coccomyxa viridis]
MIVESGFQTATGMNGEWNPSVWHLANELAGLGLQQSNAPSLDQQKAPHQFGWTQAAGDAEPGASVQNSSLPIDDSSKGWGGQAIAETPGFRAPWFGRSSRGRGNSYPGRRNTAGRGRGRGRGHRHDHHGSDHQYMNGPGLSVEDIVGSCQSLSHNAPIPDGIYQALFHFDSRATSLLLKDLSKAGLGYRAMEIFDWLRALDVSHPLRHLCDVYTYTAMISLCIYNQDLQRATQLFSEMARCGVERNVHTYTALMNVCIKCQNCPRALETYNTMRQSGCFPNVVTYNTLIDVFGKMGAWEKAVQVLTIMRSEGVDPVLRTYNTLIIACNMCGQPREAMAVYRRMLDAGYSPNATTYNALISAYGKNGQLDKVMEVFQEMVFKGCERSVITYSSLISACEKAGQSDLAMELFQEMAQEGCVPNTVTYNSLITACAQGGQWQKAGEMFQQMQRQGLTPDVVTYTAIISAYEKGGQWRLALSGYEQMRERGCRPDAIVFNAIIDALWETGVIWAQRKALSLFQQAVSEGHFRQQRWEGSESHRAEVNMHAMTAGVAMLSLYTWLMSLKQRVCAQGPGSLPQALVVVTDKGKSAKEQGNLVVKEAVSAMLQAWDAPFRASASDSMLFSGVLEGRGSEVAKWLQSPGFESQLFSFFPCSDPPSPVASPMRGTQSIGSLSSGDLEDPDFSKEQDVETKCARAFKAVLHFEQTHCLQVERMRPDYKEHYRATAVGYILSFAARLSIVDDYAHDAVLLMDRAMSTCMQDSGDSLSIASLRPQPYTFGDWLMSSCMQSGLAAEDMYRLLAASCLMLAARAGNGSADLPTPADIEHVIGIPASSMAFLEFHLRSVLANDSSAISTLRCLKLYLERLGCNHLDTGTMHAVAGCAFQLVTQSLPDIAFLNCRPSVIAAAIVYAERRSRGIIPFWPSMLSKLSGYQDMQTPELKVAIKSAQRSAERMVAGGGAAGPSPPATPAKHGA